LTVGDTAGLVSNNPAQIIITVNSAGAPQLSTVDSVMTHGLAGPFSVHLPLTGSPGIECRSGGTNGNYTMVFTFVNPLVSVDQPTITAGTGTITSGAIGTDTHQYIVSLTAVANAQRITVALVNAHDSTNTIGNVSATMAVLIGDTTASGAVNSSDISQTQSQSGQPVTSGNFREDVTVNGSINSSDISLVQAKSGTALP
jgi:hypothetical protein